MATDLLMMFSKNGNPVPGEGQSEIDSKDKLMGGFTAGGFFEIDDFDFGINLSDTDSPGVSGDKKKDEEKKAHGAKFSKWVQGTSLALGPGQSASIYPVMLDEVSLSRQMDKASVPLFYNCFRTKSFDSAVLVKRKVTGVTKATPLGRYPYLRIDFNAVLITDIGWSISDTVVKEKLKFVCRKVCVQYRPQLNDGTPGETIGGEWLSLMKAS